MGVLIPRQLGLLGLLLAACYRPPAPAECLVQCTMDMAQACPDGTTCHPDGFCHGARVEPCTAPPASGTFVGAGGRHSCALDADGVLRCWGDNRFGQLGIPLATPRANVPTPIEPDGAAILWDQVSIGWEHNCGLRRGDHALFCWGANYTHQLGVSDDPDVRAAPTQVTTVMGAWDLVSAGTYHTCGINQGALYCWGSDEEEQLGLGMGVTNMNRPSRVGMANDWVTVSAGNRHTCGIEEPVAGTRTLSCWGSGDGGKLGLGTSDELPQPTPAAITTPALEWQSVSVGTHHTCGIEAGTGDLYCWGYNDYLQLGVMTMTAQRAPVLVDDTRAWALVTAGQRNTCATTASGQLYCWGSNDAGESGTGEREFGVPLTEPQPADMWSAVSAGPGLHACAVRKTDGALFCWGENGDGQLGVGSFADEWAPVPIAGGTKWRQISAGEWTTCGIHEEDASLWCWGSQNDFGLLGEGSGVDGHVPVPVVVDGVTGWATVEVALNNVCAIDTTGGLWCWGRNDTGELGITETISYDTPQHVAAGTQWKAVAPGEGHTCAVAMNDTLWCWGRNVNGELGDGLPDNRDEPGQIAMGTSWAEVSSGEYTSCARSTLGGVSCWGLNRVGETGTGVNDDTEVPTPQPLTMPAATGWTASNLGAGYYGHGCGVNAGALHCWGDDKHGQLGRMRVTSESAVPVHVMYGGADDWTAVSAGTYATCGLRGIGALWCWGAAVFGQLGLGDTTQRDVPAHVGTATWRQVSAGGEHTCAIDDQQALWCWGHNIYGQLGDGDATRYTPQAVVQGL